MNNMDNYFPTVFILLATLFFSSYIYWFFSKKFKYWKDRNVPHIEPGIPFGNTLDLYTGKVTFGELFSNCYLELKKRGEKHGGVYYLWKPVYVPVDPEIIKKIMISDFDNFPNHGMYLNPEYDPLSNHIFNMENARWRTLRSKMPVAFTTTRMRKNLSIMVSLSEQFHKNLEANVGLTVDIKTELSKFTTDIISACGFGMESNTMKDQNSDLLKHGRNFFDYQWSLYKNTMVVMIPRDILKAIKFRIFTKATQNYVMNMYKNIFEYRKKENIVRDDLAGIIGKLTEKHDEEKDFDGKHAMEPLDMAEYATQMFVFFCAGFETSSSTQTFAVYELAKNPHCQQKLREEIKRVLAKYDNEITYDAVMEMKYLESVIDGK